MLHLQILTDDCNSLQESLNSANASYSICLLSQISDLHFNLGEIMRHTGVKTNHCGSVDPLTLCFQ